MLPDATPEGSAVSRTYAEITVVGDGDTGLIARVTTSPFERDTNIEELDQGPSITQRAFNAPPGADVEEFERCGQPLEPRRCSGPSGGTAATR